MKSKSLKYQFKVRWILKIAPEEENIISKVLKVTMSFVKHLINDLKWVICNSFETLAEFKRKLISFKNNLEVIEFGELISAGIDDQNNLIIW